MRRSRVRSSSSPPTKTKGPRFLRSLCLCWWNSTDRSLDRQGEAGHGTAPARCSVPAERLAPCMGPSREFDPLHLHQQRQRGRVFCGPFVFVGGTQQIEVSTAGRRGEGRGARANCFALAAQSGLRHTRRNPRSSQAPPTNQGAAFFCGPLGLLVELGESNSRP